MFSIQKQLIKGVLSQKTIVRKVKYIQFFNLAKRSGVISFRLPRVANEYVDDYFADTGISKSEKIKYYKKGYPSFKAKWYHPFDIHNCNDYISDFDFYGKANYQNRQFESWFEHKLNTYYLLSDFKKYMPVHYFYSRNGNIYPISVVNKLNAKIEDIIELIKKTPVAAKACVGGHGKGFYKLSYLDDKFYANDIKMTESEMVNLLKSLDDYIFTEYSIPNSKIQKLIGNNTFAVIRAVTVYDSEKGPQITGLMIRLGCKKAGYVTDYDGTIYCGINLEDGSLFTPIYRSGDSEGVMKRQDISLHPDTNEKFEGFVLPNYVELRKLLLDVSGLIPFTPYLVMDIVPTETGFHILEINSHGQVRNVEPFYPFRKNEFNLKVFKTKER